LLIFLKKLGYLFIFAGIKRKLFYHFKKLTMKNAFKFAFLGLAITLSVAACKGNGSASTADSAKADSAAVVDSAKTDSAATVDSAKKDSAATVDTAKKM